MSPYAGNSYALCVYWTHTRARAALQRQVERSDVARAWAIAEILRDGKSLRDVANALLLEEHVVQELAAAAPEQEPEMLASAGVLAQRPVPS